VSILVDQFQSVPASIITSQAFSSFNYRLLF